MTLLMFGILPHGLCFPLLYPEQWSLSESTKAMDGLFLRLHHRAVRALPANLISYHY